MSLPPPSPGGSRGKVRTIVFLQKLGFLGRIRGGDLNLNFHFDLKYSWYKLGGSTPFSSLPHFQRDPEVVFWATWFFGGLGHQIQHTTHLQENSGFWPCSRRRQAQQIIIFLDWCGFSALAPQASNKTLGKQTMSPNPIHL